MQTQIMNTSEKRDYIAPHSVTIEVKYERPIAGADSQGAQGGTETQGGGREIPVFRNGEWQNT